MTLTNSAMISDLDPTAFALAAAGVPTGALFMWGTATAPTGYLLCNGAAVSRATYAALFAILGTIYGAGDGSTTFNLPDSVGRTPVGPGTGTATDATAWALGDRRGTETHTLVEAELPTTQLGGGISMSSSDASSIAVHGTKAATGGQVDTTGSGGTLEQLVESFGSDTAHNNLQPSFCTNFIIKI